MTGSEGGGRRGPEGPLGAPRLPCIGSARCPAVNWAGHQPPPRPLQPGLAYAPSRTRWPAARRPPDPYDPMPRRKLDFRVPRAAFLGVTFCNRCRADWPGSCRVRVRLRAGTPLPPQPAPPPLRRSEAVVQPAGRPPAHGAHCGPSFSPPCPAIPPRRKGPPHCMPASGAWRSASGSGRPVARGPCVTCPPPALPAPPVNFAVPQIRRANSAGYIVDATSKHDGFCNVRTETTAMRALFLGRPWMRDCPSTPNPWQSCGSCQ